MTVQMNVHMNGGGVVMATLPDPSRIPVKAVREAVETLAKRLSKLREAKAASRLAFDAHANARERARVEAARAAEDGGAVPAKKLAKAIRDAEAAADEARIEVAARESAAVKAQVKLVETIEKHTPAWRASMLESLEASILKLTTAREMTRRADIEMQESLGVLGMLNRLPLDRMPVMLATDASAPLVSESLGNIGAAIGAAMEVLDVERGAAASKPDVVIAVPGEDQVDEIPAVEIEASGDDGE